MAAAKDSGRHSDALTAGSSARLTDEPEEREGPLFSLFDVIEPILCDS